MLNQMFDKNHIRPVDNMAEKMTSSNDNEPNTYDRVADSSLNQFEMMPINGATMSDIDLTRLKQPNTDTANLDCSKPTAVQTQDGHLHSKFDNHRKKCFFLGRNSFEKKGRFQIRSLILSKSSSKNYF